jgi:hypothetical protein
MRQLPAVTASAFFHMLFFFLLYLKLFLYIYIFINFIECLNSSCLAVALVAREKKKGEIECL